MTAVYPPPRIDLCEPYGNDTESILGLESQYLRVIYLSHQAFPLNRAYCEEALYVMSVLYVP